MANGTQIHQWGFHRGNTQKWEFKHYDDGYYYIRSCNTSVVPMYFLTVQNDSTVEGAKIVLQSSISTGSQWKITSTSNGAYKITAKTGEANNRVLAVEWVTGDTTANGLDMEQKNYQDNDSYLDEWKLYDVVFSFVNYYDSSLVPINQTNETILSTIPNANDYVKSVFKRLFDVDFKTVGEPIYEDIIISGCTSPTTYCTDVCGSCEDHHRNVYNVANKCNENLARENNQISVVWTSRFGEYCETINGVHKLYGYDNVELAGVVDHRPVINFYYIPGSDENFLKGVMSCVLLHEVAHSFGLPDVYDTDWHDGEEGLQCVMEKSNLNGYYDFYENTINNGSPFCSSCEQNLRTLIANKYFEGK